MGKAQEIIGFTIAPLASPAFTGTPTAPTQTAYDNSTKLATTAYVDAAIAGLDVKPDVQYCSTTALPANTYNNGSSGVGATLTGNANGPLIIDGVTILIGQVGERVLVAGEAAQANNGWYTITQQGVIALSPYILTRATESDQAAEIGPGYLTGVIAPNSFTPGSSNNGKIFISVAADPFVVGTTALTFSQVGSTYSAGNGLGLSGTTFSIDTSVTVDKTTAQTLTNKTLTTPVISAISNTGTVTLFTATDTVVGKATTDTLTNKRVTQRVINTTQSATPTINTDNTDISHITGLAQAITSFTTNLSGTPNAGDTLMINITDNGTARAITWGASFEASTVALPTTTVVSTRLDIAFIWNEVTSKWRCIGVS